ncbi:Hypothetical protein NTJ_06552 [Nesidiocoris tenuis]|uniref:Uncharacterized protein n=1 Tax=Nesidiocoris tenuis TaxID=355587 RepID=A0ABN7ATK5_9HEMI|nr:Hypothetical protein NTJ_06552 [Nesidiocoris tenuis]
MTQGPRVGTAESAASERGNAGETTGGRETESGRRLCRVGLWWMASSSAGAAELAPGNTLPTAAEKEEESGREREVYESLILQLFGYSFTFRDVYGLPNDRAIKFHAKKWFPRSLLNFLEYSHIE